MRNVNIIVKIIICLRSNIMTIDWCTVMVNLLLSLGGWIGGWPLKLSKFRAKTFPAFPPKLRKYTTHHTKPSRLS
jgi:hypothetical protein